MSKAHDTPSFFYCLEFSTDFICVWWWVYHPDTSILEDAQVPDDDEISPSVLKEEVEKAILSLKPGKSPGMDNVPTELLKCGGEATTKALTKLCQRIWEKKRWPREWTQSLIIPLPKKDNLRQCQNYRTIRLISHHSKVMLRVILTD
ncbi:uncharacterized protein LOC125651319 [Ostrea edulis]|uniref:uncharacterized protein LOC125651319 n=1 Tax=Ostrea edulis TaxID=37623 RepID=UPI0024AEC617|nr:uncharacterized protein LOC125651319 [Ostrea edulis]